jgi:hypothetical protein
MEVNELESHPFIQCYNIFCCLKYFYKDVIFGFDFAPLLYENQKTGKLEVDLGLVNDVREQRQGSGQDLRELPSACSRAAFGGGRASSLIVTRRTMKASL